VEQNERGLVVAASATVGGEFPKAHFQCLSAHLDVFLVIFGFEVISHGPHFPASTDSATP
jgi:hypothetical protein